MPYYLQLSSIYCLGDLSQSRTRPCPTTTSTVCVRNALQVTIVLLTSVRKPHCYTFKHCNCNLFIPDRTRQGWAIHTCPVLKNRWDTFFDTPPVSECWFNIPPPPRIRYLILVLTWYFLETPLVWKYRLDTPLILSHYWSINYPSIKSIYSMLFYTGPA